MISKVIHYCWFGKNPLPKSAKKCISSWKKYFPDYEIKEWNEDNFDVNSNIYTKFCYEHNLWAYLSDYVRLVVMERYGGWYFDTDVEVIRYPREFIDVDALFCWEPTYWVNTGLGFAAKAHHKALIPMMRIYQDYSLEQLEKRFKETKSLTGCPRMNTNQLLKLGLIQNGLLQQFSVDGDSVIVLSSDYMCPFDDITGEIKKTSNTFSIHWYTKSANSKYAFLKSKLSRPFHRLINLINGILS